MNSRDDPFILPRIIYERDNKVASSLTSDNQRSSKMPQALMPDISYDRYLELARFISEAIQNDTEEARGVPGKRLRQLYLDHYTDQNRLDDRAYIEEEKGIIVRTIRYMVHVRTSWLGIFLHGN